MKEGDKVKVIDGSYMLTIKGQSFSRYGKYKSTKIIGLCKDTFTIIATDGKYPTAQGHPIGDHLGIENNMIIVNDVNDEVWFCSAINIMFIL